MAKAKLVGNYVGLVMSRFQAEVLLRILYAHVRGGSKGRAAMTDEGSVLHALTAGGVSADNTQKIEGYIDIERK